MRRWTNGVLVGLVAAITSTLILLLAGALSGRGWHILADAGMAALPSTVRLASGLVLVTIFIEFGFLVFTTESQASGRVDEVTWRSLLVAHAVGDVVFALGILRAHPTLRQALVRGYEW